MKKYSLLLFVLLSMFQYEIFAAKFTLESSAFKLNTLIPIQYTCNGANQSPALSWHDVPPKTQSLALIVEDPDAPNGAWTHWILFNIPTTVIKLDTGTPAPEGATTGKNSFGNLGYSGPCPSIGAHRYVFKLYALDKVLSLGEGAVSTTVEDAMTGHVLGSAELVGLYQKVP